MTDFIPHYFTVIDPLALFVLACTFVIVLVGWVVCMISDERRRK